jgi:predicted SprT family Zn-dependent metalloprotease
MDAEINAQITRDNATLVNINKSTIDFTCKCGSLYSKTKRAFSRSGAFCKHCTQRNTSIKKIANKIALNNSLLEKY